MSRIDYEAEYNNRRRVADAAEIIASWAEESAAYRAIHPPTLVRYGVGERHVIDVFGPEGAAPTVLFIHGGYWQALSKDHFSHLARGLNAHRVRAAIMSYDLCPQVPIGDILAQARAACAMLAQHFASEIVVSGHSAGGHLAACLLAQETHVRVAHAISGVFELAPLIDTSLNAALRLDAEEAEALSPLRWAPPHGKTLDALVGEAESGEFLRQSRAIVEVWGEAGVATRYEEIEGANHFTVLAPLADPGSAMCARVVELALRSKRSGA